MQLSEAILLGNSITCRDPLVFLSQDSVRGCALGGALVAAGLAEQFHQERRERYGCIGGFTSYPVVHSAWPWLTELHVATISTMYAMRLPVEAIVEYVRFVEPQDAAPVQNTELPRGWRDGQLAGLDLASGAREVAE